MAGDLKEKVGGLADQHGDKVTGAVEKGTDFVDDKTGGKITTVTDKVDDLTGKAVDALKSGEDKTPPADPSV
ncbi:MAG: antitoxin [Actinomycetota bacterium]|nr:MAG: antitoxin [Actinomycetota bacterium]